MWQLDAKIWQLHEWWLTIHNWLAIPKMSGIRHMNSLTPRRPWYASVFLCIDTAPRVKHRQQPTSTLVGISLVLSIFRMRATTNQRNTVIKARIPIVMNLIWYLIGRSSSNNFANFRFELNASDRNYVFLEPMIAGNNKIENMAGNKKDIGQGSRKKATKWATNQ